MDRRLEDFVKNELSKDNSGHGYFHALRVWRNAEQIQRVEGGNLRIIEAAALSHDVIDDKIFPDPLSQLKKLIAVLALSYTEEEINSICYIIENISYRKEKASTSPLEGKEAAIVRDADRLEALGAIGLIRTIEYGNSKNRPFIVDSDIKDIEEGREPKNHGSTLDHFYEKLLLLEPLFLTETGKKMARARTILLHDFLSQLYLELGIKTD